MAFLIKACQKRMHANLAIPTIMRWFKIVHKSHSKCNVTFFPGFFFFLFDYFFAVKGMGCFFLISIFTDSEHDPGGSKKKKTHRRWQYSWKDLAFKVELIYPALTAVIFLQFKGMLNWFFYCLVFSCWPDIISRKRMNPIDVCTFLQGLFCYRKLLD